MARPNVISMPELEARHDPWPEPLPLICHGRQEPYPVDALPELARLAVAEVQNFTKAPVALVAGSGLAALSLAAQSLVDVKRAEKLTGPSGLYLLTVADSGERKTTCDSLFMDPIREWEQQQAEKAKPALKDYRGSLEAWEATQDGIKNRIRADARKGKSTAQGIRDAQDHEAIKPQPPRVPRLVRVDATPEALAWCLAHEWPGAGVISSEAGLVLGSHGMGGDSIMRYIGFLNNLWDGKPHPISRRTTESFTVRGARLTVALQVQEATLRAFFEQSEGLARGMGFVARFLIAWPESTQGYRPFTEAPESWPALEEYQRRIASLLDTPAPIDADGTLTPALLTLSPEGKSIWVQFHDDIEAELKSDGELFNVRDVAAKGADNAARLAALFHALEHGPAGVIRAESIAAAGRIAAWHLTEARRFMGALALPLDVANAVKLDAWLIERCREHATGAVSTGDILQFGPHPVRRADGRDSALDVLADAGRVRIEQAGRQKRVRVNPALVPS